ncbi:hypothetical protein IEQ34_021599 [Dendrobium chrysotoxum]|uniref:Uncharacterized protein n=1 Tax=Dendrobium chrysotoxum TaxID=161865 RepID=A0AAV7G571_DENCH|nr:hypothetical protein IEQ34_021599 [Dendrobium chrysotoxum]
MIFFTTIAYQLRFFRPTSPDYGLFDHYCLPTTVLPTSFTKLQYVLTTVAHRLWSFRPLSPDNDLSNHHRLPTTVPPATVIRLRSFRPPSPTDYGPADQTNMSILEATALCFRAQQRLVEQCWGTGIRPSCVEFFVLHIATLLTIERCGIHVALPWLGSVDFWRCNVVQIETGLCGTDSSVVMVLSRQSLGTAISTFWRSSSVSDGTTTVFVVAQVMSETHSKVLVVPSNVDRHLQIFLRMKPLRFESAIEPIAVEDWLRRLEKTFDGM